MHTNHSLHHLDERGSAMALLLIVAVVILAIALIAPAAGMFDQLSEQLQEVTAA